jgi:hypothetical protein
MAAERRASVIENAGGFVPFVGGLGLVGRGHFGLVLTSGAGLPRSRNHDRARRARARRLPR